MKIDRERMDRDEKYLERLYKKGLITQQEDHIYTCRIKCFSHLEDMKKAIKEYETTKAMDSLLKLRGEIDKLHSLRPFVI